MAIRIVEVGQDFITAEAYYGVSDGRNVSHAHWQTYIYGSSAGSSDYERSWQEADSVDASGNFQVTFGGLDSETKYLINVQLFDEDGVYVTSFDITQETKAGPKTYSIYYSASSATGVPDGEEFTVAEGETVGIWLSGTTPQRTGYRFKNWRVSQSGNLLGYYDAGAWLEVGPGNITATAQWEALSSYTVRYNANGGASAPSSQTVYKDQEFTVRTTKPSRSGYTFVGWVVKGTSSGEIWGMVGPGDVWSTGENITLIAEWYKYKIDLTAGANIAGVNGPMGLPYVNYDGTTDTTASIWCTLKSIKGYEVTFDGWYDASGALVSDSLSFEIANLTEDVAYTARATARKKGCDVKYGVGGVWKDAAVKVGRNGKWVDAAVKGGVDGTWKPNGE